MKYRKVFYSRGNCGSTEFTNQTLLELSDQVVGKLEEGENIDKIKSFLGNYPFPKGIGYEIDDDDEIVLFDKNIEDGDSWGYDEIRIEKDWEEDIDRMVRATEKYVDPEGEYEVVEFDKGDYAMSCLPILEEGDIISGKEVLQIVEEIATYLYNVEPEQGAIDYGWGKDDFTYEISREKIIIETRYICQLGAYDQLFREKIHLQKV